LELVHFLFVPQESIFGAITGHISSLSTPSLTVNATELVSAGVGTVDEEGKMCHGNFACRTPFFSPTFELLSLQGLHSSGLHFTAPEKSDLSKSSTLKGKFPE